MIIFLQNIKRVFCFFKDIKHHIPDFKCILKKYRELHIFNNIKTSYLKDFKRL